MQSAGFDVCPIADDIAHAITNRWEDERLTWYPDGRVRVLISKIVPADSAVGRTLQGRRQRFWDVLDERVHASGWVRLRANVYGPQGG